MMKAKLLFGMFLLMSSSTLFAQEDDPFTVDYDTPLTIDLESEKDLEDELAQPKKKKVKRNVFYGLKTKRGFSKKLRNGKVIREEFRYLKEPVEFDRYVRDIHWFNYKKKTITTSRKFDPKNGVILHGPYTKWIGDQILERGIYYKGMRHGRWTRYNKYDILQDKEKYYKGWPKLSKVAYYDKERKKLREIIPVQFGEKEGNYFAFHESGRIAAKGEFQFDRKVGIWIEYYDQRKRKKKEIQYPEDPFDDDFVPYIIREWDEKGIPIYDRKKYTKSLVVK